MIHRIQIFVYMDVSENSGTPKSSILMGFSIINHPFLGTFIFGNAHMFFLYTPHSHLIITNETMTNPGSTYPILDPQKIPVQTIPI